MRRRHEHPLLARLATGLFCFVLSLVVRTAVVAGGAKIGAHLGGLIRC